MRVTALMVTAAFALSLDVFAQNSAPAVPPTTSSTGATVVTVNTEAITAADIDRWRSANAGASLGTALVSLIDDRLVAQRGKALGYGMSDQQFSVILANIKRANNITSDEQFVAALRQENLTNAELRTNLEHSAIVSRVLRREALAQISDADARQYFDAHLADFPLQTFETARPEVIRRLRADQTTNNQVVKQYLQSLRRSAAIVWSRTDLQQAYEQAAR